MNSSFPQPTFGSVGKNFNETKSPQAAENQYNTTTALVSKSPSSPAFGRSPLASLGAENGPGFVGMRQRRGGGGVPSDAYDKHNNNNALVALSSNSDATAVMRPPPRASLTMSMGPKTSSMEPTTTVTNESTSIMATNDDYNNVSSDHRKSDECWALIYGFTNHQQYEDVTQKFKKMGHVVEVKGGPPKNWVAIRYETALDGARAIATDPFAISGGSICGVHRLQDSQKFFQSQQHQIATIHGGEETDGAPKKGLFNTGIGSSSSASVDNNETDYDDDADIYVPRKEEMEISTNRNICERFMGWIYGW